VLKEDTKMYNRQMSPFRWNGSYIIRIFYYC